MPGSPQLRPLGETLGTEALGIDLSRLDDATFAWIEQAFAEHPVLVFRDQNLGAAELAAFGRRFGAPRMHALVKYRHAGPPGSLLADQCRRGRQDRLVRRQARHRLAHRLDLRGRCCRCWRCCTRRRCPSEKGGTMFADMRAAYDALARGDEAAARRASSGCTAAATAPPASASTATTRASTDKKYPRSARPAVIAASGDRPADPVRQPDAHARLRRHGRARRPGR